MKHNIIQELRAMSLEELQQQVEDLRRALFSLRLSATTSHIKDFSQFKKLRRNIARSLSVLSAKQGVSSKHKEHSNE